MADSPQNTAKKKKAGEADQDDVFEAPVVVREPSAKQIQLGAKLLLRVVASGKPRPSYQWFLNGKKITGATADRYLVSKTRREHAGAYTCEVKNYVGKATSRAAMISLLVQRIPPLVIEPATAALAAGKSFRLALTSFPPELAAKFAFQWTFNGKRIVGAKGPVLEFTHLKKKYEGEYKVMLLLGGDLRTSNVASLKVLAATATAEEEVRAAVAVPAPRAAAPLNEDFFFNPEDEGAEEAPRPAFTLEDLNPDQVDAAADLPAPEGALAPVANLGERRDREKLRRQRRKLEAMLRAWQELRAGRGSSGRAA